MSKLVPAPLPLNRYMAARVQRYVAAYALVSVPGGNGQPARVRLQAPDAVIQLDTALGKQVALAGTRADGTYELEEVVELLKASASVAYLFSPTLLAYCDATQAALSAGCLRDGPGGAPLERSRFIDGGAIDNAPLFAAIRLMELHDSRPAAPGDSSGTPPPRATLFVSYDARRSEPGIRGDSGRMLSDTNGPCIPAPRVEECGGIRALRQFFGGLLNTGGNYELQWLIRLRARDPGLRALDVDLTTRRAAIGGEHLMNASAFLGRPLREFDFHVGIYDALHFAASAVLCLDEHRPPTQTGDRNQCIVDTIRGLVDRFPLSCQSSLTVDLLLRQEYGIEGSETMRERQLHQTKHCDDASSENRLRYLAYRSIFRAVTAVAEDTVPQCGRAGMIVGALCGEGTLRVFRQLRDDGLFVAYARREAGQCNRDLAPLPADARPAAAAQCFATDRFVSALEDPERRFFEWIRALLDRAQWLEEEVGRRRAQSGASRGMDVATQWLNFGLRTALLAEDVGVVAFPTIVPERKNAWRLLTGLVVPQELSLDALGNGWGYGWLPFAYRWRSGAAVDVGVGVERNGFASTPDGTTAGPRHTRFVVSGRAGLRTIMRGHPILSGVMAGARYVHPATADRLDGPVPLDRRFAPELRVNLFWDRFALTLSRTPRFGFPGERQETRIAVSLLDPGGMLYWTLRSPSLR